jgi:hypothetical protein
MPVLIPITPSQRWPVCRRLPSRLLPSLFGLLRRLGPCPEPLRLGEPGVELPLTAGQEVAVEGARGIQAANFSDLGAQGIGVGEKRFDFRRTADQDRRGLSVGITSNAICSSQIARPAAPSVLLPLVVRARRTGVGRVRPPVGIVLRCSTIVRCEGLVSTHTGRWPLGRRGSAVPRFGTYGERPPNGYKRPTTDSRHTLQEQSPGDGPDALQLLPKGYGNTDCPSKSSSQLRGRMWLLTS